MNTKDWETLLSQSVDRERATEEKYRKLAARQTAAYEIIEATYEVAIEFDEEHPFWPVVVAYGWESHFPKKYDEFGR
jgi:hypothetical protein